tara:strand:+ start:2539 stop:5025 length:2487 start_codon:yes stop_codon:yes gene_type:complete
MAKKPQAYDNIDRNFTLVGQPLEGDPLEIELPPEPTELTTEGMEVTPMEDGGVEIGDPEQDSMNSEVDFSSNLAEVLEDDVLAGISSMVLEKAEEDISGRKDWMDAYSDGLKLLGLNYDQRTEPFEGATGVIHPLLNEAVVQFQSQAYKELLPPSGPVRTQILGDATPALEKQSERIKDYMNYTIMHTMEEYDAEFDQMLYYLGLGGSAFKKVYVDPQLGRQVSKFIEAKDLLVPYNATDLMSADRVTQMISMNSNELRKLQVSGFYRDVEITGGAGNIDEVTETKESITGIERTGEGDEVTLYESHCYLDLEQFPDTDESGEETGIKLPYIVTVDDDSGEVLSVYRNYDPEDSFKSKRQFFVHYMFSPGLGFYGNGLIHLLGNLSRTATAVLRQLVDSGTLANMPAGFKARGLRIQDGDEPIQPGEWRDVDVVGTDLKGSLLPLPYKEPSATLFQLLGFVVQAAQKFVGTTDMGTGNVSNAEVPVGTTIAMLERGSRIISAVHKRLYNSMKQEFKLMAEIIAQEGGEYPFANESAEKGQKAKDFDGRIDIVPVANPNMFSMAQRVSLAQEQLKLAQTKPELHNLYEAYRRMYSALGVDNIEQVLPPPAEPTPTAPSIENGKVMQALSGQAQLKAFPEQNHEAHIATHLAYMGSVVAKGNPGIIQILQTHIFEHISLQAQAMAQQEMQEQPQEQSEMPETMGQAMPEDMPQAMGQATPPVDAKLLANKVAEIEAKLISEYVEKEKQIMQADQKDPLVDLKAQEIQIKQQEAQQEAQNDQQRLKLDQQKLQEQTAIQQQRINSTEDIAQLRANIALQRQQQNTNRKPGQ